jgi:hypothetical protein
MFEGQLTEDIVDVLKNFESNVLNDLYRSCFIYRNHVGRIQYQEDKGFYGEVIFSPCPTQIPQYEKNNVYQLFQAGSRFGKPFSGNNMKEAFDALNGLVDEMIQDLESRIKEAKEKAND